MQQTFAARERELNTVLKFRRDTGEEEKTLLARALHDELGGVLTSAKIDIAWLKKVSPAQDPDAVLRWERLAKAVDEAVSIERRAVESLRPSLLDHLGIGAALDWYVSDVCKSAAIACRQKSLANHGSVPADVAIAIYRLVQEAMCNIVEGAQADEITIGLERDGDGLHLRLSHNGLSAPEQFETQHQQRHASMRHRAVELGGRFDVEYPDGGGTSISAFFPHQQLSAEAETAPA